ncbi:MAG: hypothetical protein F7C34_05615, partial [Desulfurococcales archaeon]|nr:hypothetical protein [Desulfurococcales archaeon]
QELMQWAEWRAKRALKDIEYYEERREKQEAILKELYRQGGASAVLRYVAENLHVLRYFGYEVNTDKINVIELDDNMLFIYLDAVTVLIKICYDSSDLYCGDYLAQLDDTHYITIGVSRG